LWGLEAAQPAATARRPGPLSGIPVAIKDIIATSDMPTTNGSPIYRDHIPAADAWVVERLRNLGATIFGKTVSTEFAWRHPGPTVNPWNGKHTPGGSSSGSGSAVAARLTFAALGSDTGGSLRMPAHFCGVTGLKVTWGRISRAGAMPLSQSLDTVGPLARTAADCALLLGLMANWLSAALADAAILFYIFVYTLLLKRRSPANIVIGGAAGCFPVLVGWAAVTGTIAVPAIVLFAVIFLWTPPHFWALAMKFKDDYARANVPMLPVVASPAAVTRKILLYSYAMVAATLVLAPYAGWLYAAAAVGLGGWFLVEAHRLDAQVRADGADKPFPMRLFHLSIAYLTLLFLVVAIAALLPVGRW